MVSVTNEYPTKDKLPAYSRLPPAMPTKSTDCQVTADNNNPRLTKIRQLLYLMLAANCLLAMMILTNTLFYQLEIVTPVAQQCSTPEQVHLSLGANDTELWVTWSTSEPCEQAWLIYYKRYNIWRDEQIVQAQRTDTELDLPDAPTVNRTYYTYRAKMTHLEPGSTYLYSISMTDLTTCDSGLYAYLDQVYVVKPKDLSNVLKTFTIAMFGDLGFVEARSVPLLTQQVLNSKYDLVIHNGDFAYDLNDDQGRLGDKFMNLIEPIASRVPYQTSVGNHEIAQNFTHYDMRFTMVNSAAHSNGVRNNFYYSFNVGPVHFIAFSSEFYYFVEISGREALRAQYEWLVEDLELATSRLERAKRPWIIVFGHRPMYCSDSHDGDCLKSYNLLRKGLEPDGSYALEKLFYDYGVDVIFSSHEHQYERFLPIYDGEVMNSTTVDPYVEPSGPVHIVSGSAGCTEELDPFNTTLAPGSVVRISEFSFTKLEASRCSLTFTQLSTDQQGEEVDKFTIRKTKQNFPKPSKQTNGCPHFIGPHKPSFIKF